MSKEAKPRPKGELPEVELHPDAWERFEKFIDKVARAPPQHRPAKPPKAPKRNASRAAN